MIKNSLRAYLKKFLQQGWVSFFDAIVVTDDIDKENSIFSQAANLQLRHGKFHQFSPLIKKVNPNFENSIRDEYGLNDCFSVLFTIGGGGIVGSNGKSEADELVPIFNDICFDLKEEGINIKGIILSGYFSGTYESSKNVLIKKHENRFMELLSVVDLVVCQGGANTLAEVLSVGVPVIIIPAKRGTTDLQSERAKKMLKITKSSYLENVNKKLLKQEIEKYYKNRNNNGIDKFKLCKSDGRLADFLIGMVND